MSRVGKVGVAIILSLVMTLSLLTSSVFAQSVHQSNANTSAHAGVTAWGGFGRFGDFDDFGRFGGFFGEFGRFGGFGGFGDFDDFG